MSASFVKCKMKFQVGDRVTVVAKEPDGLSGSCVGLTGTVCRAESAVERIGVRMDEKPAWGHTCDSTCDKGYGRYFWKSQLELYEEEDIDEDSFLQVIGGNK